MNTKNLDFKKLRLSHGLTQKAMAEKLGVTQRLVQYYEADSSKISDKVLKSIVEEFFSRKKSLAENLEKPILNNNATMEELLKSKNQMIEHLLGEIDFYRESIRGLLRGSDMSTSEGLNKQTG